MQATLSTGAISIGRGGTEEALNGRYPTGTDAPTLVTAAELGLDEPSPHGDPSGKLWQQAFVYYCNCAEVGGLVLASDAKAFSEWISSHGVAGLPDGRLFALIGRHLLAVHTQSSRGAHSVSDGSGCSIWPSGSYYIGAFKGDKRHGQGTHVLPSGECYVGTWEQGKKHGMGKMEFANGNVYSGAWESNEKHGEGVLRYHDGSKYIGTFEHNKRNGEGTFVFGSTGVRYVGQWVDEHMEGNGIMYEQRGKKVVGTWSKGKKDGAFVTSYAGSSKLEKETWREGQLVDYAEEENPLGASPAEEEDAEDGAQDQE